MKPILAYSTYTHVGGGRALGKGRRKDAKETLGEQEGVGETNTWTVGETNT